MTRNSSIFSKTFLFAFCAAMLASPILSSAAPSQDLKISSIHVFVPLGDSTILTIPGVSPRLMDGNNAVNNFFWSGKQGFKNYFKTSGEWELVLSIQNYEQNIVERAFFVHKASGAMMVADAYRSSASRSAILDFLEASSGGSPTKVKTQINGKETIFNTGGNADALVFFGHNGLMEFTIDPKKLPAGKNGSSKLAMVVSEYSKSHFEKLLKKTGARPLLLIDGPFVPVAYVPEMILDGLLSGDPIEKVKDRVITAYDERQTVGYNTAEQMFKILE